MKKILFILTLLLALPVTIFASEVKITNIEVLDKTNTIEDSTPEYQNLVANLNLKFNNISDGIKYKIDIRNDSRKDFNINLKNNAESNKYFDFTYTGDKVINPGGTGSIIIDAKYVKNLEKEDMTDTDYIENITLGITSDVIEIKENPKTGFNIKEVLIYSISIVLIGIYGYLRVTKNKKFALFIILPLLVVPLAYASQTTVLTININSSIKNDPYIFKYVIGKKHEECEPETYDLIRIDPSRIIEYSVPTRYNLLYGETIESIDSIFENRVIIDASNSELIRETKNNLVESFITSIETSRTITYKIYEYYEDINNYIETINIEYDKNLATYKMVGNNFISFQSLFEYIQSTNPEYIVLDVENMKVYDKYGNEIENEEEYMNIGNQDFMIAHINDMIEIASKQGISQIDTESAVNSIIGIKYLNDNDYSSHLYLSANLHDDIYKRGIGSPFPENEILLSGDGIIYYSYTKNN